MSEKFKFESEIKGIEIERSKFESQIKELK
jgi:hypothetical protein